MPYLKRILEKIQAKDRDLSLNEYRKKLKDEDSVDGFNRTLRVSNTLLRQLKKIGLINEDRNEDDIKIMLKMRMSMDSLMDMRKKEFLKILEDENTAMFLNKFLAPVLMNDACISAMYERFTDFKDEIKEPTKDLDMIINAFDGVVVSDHWLTRCNHYRVDCSETRGFIVIDEGFEYGMQHAGRSTKRDKESLSRWRDSDILIIKRRKNVVRPF